MPQLHINRLACATVLSLLLTTQHSVSTYADKFPDQPILQLIFLTSTAASMLQNRHHINYTGNTKYS